MILEAKCDVCGKIIQGDDIYSDGEGRDLCQIDKLRITLVDMRAHYARTEAWLESVFLSAQREKLAEIETLEQKIKRLLKERDLCQK